MAAWQGLLGSIKAVPHALARERERVVRSKQPSKGSNKRQRIEGCRSSDTKHVSPASRVVQFPNNYLEVRSTRLFCACRQSNLALRKTSIQQHVPTSTHKKNMVKRQTMADVRRAPNIEEALSRTPNINTRWKHKHIEKW